MSDTDDVRAGVHAGDEDDVVCAVLAEGFEAGSGVVVRGEGEGNGVNVH